MHVTLLSGQNLARTGVLQFKICLDFYSKIFWYSQEDPGLLFRDGVPYWHGPYFVVYGADTIAIDLSLSALIS